MRQKFNVKLHYFEFKKILLIIEVLIINKSKYLFLKITIVNLKGNQRAYYKFDVKIRNFTISQYFGRFYYSQLLQFV